MWKYQRTISGYHGCDAAVADAVLLGKQTLEPSSNSYDWLGKGIYFWEHGPARALHWAQEIHQRRPERVGKPAVIGAVLQLGFCFDLADIEHTRFLRELYPLFCKHLESLNRPVPRNMGLGGDQDLVLRFLDCAMIDWSVPVIEHELDVRIQTVRCVFVEKAPRHSKGPVFGKNLTFKSLFAIRHASWDTFDRRLDNSGDELESQRMAAKSKSQNLHAPAVPHLTAADFKQVLDSVRKMSRENLHESMVKAGILTKTGKLAKRYRSE